ncbi:MAG: AAA family ATPase [Oscillospiraceae bacterium]|nr:AAA family ATPase [Oscillospiraceae bacterium]
MKRVYIIGGPMGVGKTTVCQELKKRLPASVFLDGDWCWDMSPFQVTDEIKRMVHENISFLLNQFILCSAFENIIFCWVMHEQGIIDAIVDSLDRRDSKVISYSLICDEQTLRSRLQKDIDQGIRSEDVIPRSLARIPLYDSLDTIKIDTTGKSVGEICDAIINLSDQVR